MMIVCLNSPHKYIRHLTILKNPLFFLFTIICFIDIYILNFQFIHKLIKNLFTIFRELEYRYVTAEIIRDK